MQQLVGRFPFQPLHEATDRYLWGNGHEEMDMILSDMTADEHYSCLGANLAQQLSHPGAHLPLKSRLTILGHPHEVQMDFEHGMRAVAVLITHTTSVPHPSGVRAKAVA